MTLLLRVPRRTGEGERHVRNRVWTGWRPTHMMGTQVIGKTLGVIGLGRIGRATAARAHNGFGMKVIYFDPYPAPEDFIASISAESRETVEDVLKEADFVSVHCPATPENRHLINAERLACMRSDAFLVNTARGDIVDEAALVKALESRQIAGAGLDVFEREPRVSAGLHKLDNVVLLPRLGSATIETRVAMGLRVLDNAKAFFAGKKPPDRVA